ncbi:Transcription-associated protein 1 [Trichinella zimbabwensis]|uniref:Transcription-associated protein 1 n=1 Tax=Trichinella zimbabwensis TaxID=268475 RepID=A0A0V1HRU8_9BILA|nr:Transcription-associated protein 1 [Trichinella zimbabwensis]KRZ13290.1 Transcription-associated protein 1 [Trichinella zimbabwensis]
MFASPAPAYSKLIGEIEVLVSTLQDSNQNERAKLKAMRSLSERFDTVSSVDSLNSVADVVYNTLLNVLHSSSPQFILSSDIQELRLLTLKLIHQVPSIGERMKPFWTTAVSTLFRLIAVENEQNGVICARILRDILHDIRVPFTVEITQFMLFSLKMFVSIPDMIKEMFGPRNRQPVAHEPCDSFLQHHLDSFYRETVVYKKDPAKGEGFYMKYFTVVPKTSQSVKLLAELPALIQIVNGFHSKNIREEYRSILCNAAKFLYLAPTSEQRKDPDFDLLLFEDFLNAKSKTMALFADTMDLTLTVLGSDEAYLPEAILNTLESVPSGSVSIRREMLVVIRQLIHTRYRDKFAPYSDRVFNEAFALGDDHTAKDQLRAYWLPLLGDYVFNMRNVLDQSTIMNGIRLFSRYLFDCTLTSNCQIIAMRSLSVLSDVISQQKDRTAIHPLHYFLLELFIHRLKGFCKEELILKGKPPSPRRMKIDWLNNSTTAAAAVGKTAAAAAAAIATAVPPKKPVEAQATESIQEKNESKSNAEDAEPVEATKPQAPESDDMDCVFQYGDVRFGFSPTRVSFSSSEQRKFFKNLAISLRSILGHIVGRTQNLTTEHFVSGKILAPKHIRMLRDYFRLGFNCLDTFFMPSVRAPGSSITREEKELMELFCQSLGAIPPLIFAEILSSEFSVNEIYYYYYYCDFVQFTFIDLSFQLVVRKVSLNETLWTIINLLSTVQRTSSSLVAVGMEYILDNLIKLGFGQDTCVVEMKLLKLIFSAVTTYPQQNEIVLKSYMPRLISSCLDLARSADDAYNQLFPLRLLLNQFSSRIQSTLFQAFVPLVPRLLKGQFEKFPDVELSSSLLDFRYVSVSHAYVHVYGCCMAKNIPLYYIALSLQALRVLENMIDMPMTSLAVKAIRPVRVNLLRAIWKVLRECSDEKLATDVWRCLSKLGGLNRYLIVDPELISNVGSVNPQPSACIQCSCESNFPVALNYNIELHLIFEQCYTNVSQTLNDNALQVHSCAMCRNVLMVLLGPHGINIDLFRNRFKISEIQPWTDLGDNFTHPSRQMMINIIATVLLEDKACNDSLELTAFAKTILRTMICKSIDQQISDPGNGEENGKQDYMDALIVIDAVVKILKENNSDLHEVALKTIETMYDLANSITGSVLKSSELYLFQYMFNRVISLSYERPYYIKLSCCNALMTLIECNHLLWVTDQMKVILPCLIAIIIDNDEDFDRLILGTVHKCWTLLLSKVIESANCICRSEVCRRLVYIVLPYLTSSSESLRRFVKSTIEFASTELDVSRASVLKPYSRYLSILLSPEYFTFPLKSTIMDQIAFLDAFSYIHSIEPFIIAFKEDSLEIRNFLEKLKMILQLSAENDTPATLFSGVAGLRPCMSDNWDGMTEAAHRAEELKLLATRALYTCFVRSSLDTRHKLVLYLVQTLIRSSKTIQEEAFRMLEEIKEKNWVSCEMLHLIFSSMTKLYENIRGRHEDVGRTLLYCSRLSPSNVNQQGILLASTLKSFSYKLTNFRSALAKDQSDYACYSYILQMFGEMTDVDTTVVHNYLEAFVEMETLYTSLLANRFRSLLLPFTEKFPVKVTNVFFDTDFFRDSNAIDLYIWLLKNSRSVKLRAVLYEQPCYLMSLIAPKKKSKISYEDRTAVMLRLVLLLSKRDGRWLQNNSHIFNWAYSFYTAPNFANRYSEQTPLWYYYWKTPKRLLKILLQFYRCNRYDFQLLLTILSAFNENFVTDLLFLIRYLERELLYFPVEWKRQSFFKLAEMMENPAISDSIKSTFIQTIIVPGMAEAMERGRVSQFIGPLPDSPEAAVQKNLVVTFVEKFLLSDIKDIHLRILISQMGCLFIKHASEHITTKKSNVYLLNFLQFGWPCLQEEHKHMDPVVRYHGLMLISYAICQFSINRQVIVQVLDSLMNATSVEARFVVRQAFAVLMLALSRMDDGMSYLLKPVRQILIEEHYSSAKTLHLLGLLLRNYLVFYFLRHDIMPYLVPLIQKLLSSEVNEHVSSIEFRTIAVDLIETILKWEVVRKKRLVYFPNEGGGYCPFSLQSKFVSYSSDRPIELSLMRSIVVNLLKVACKSHEQLLIAPPPPNPAVDMDYMTKHCIQLVKRMFNGDILGSKVDSFLNLWIEDILLHTETPVNLTTIYVHLELLCTIVTVMSNERIMPILESIQRALLVCFSCPNTQITRSIYSLFTKLHAAFGEQQFPEIMARLPILCEGVGNVLTDALNTFENRSTGGIGTVYTAVTLLKAMSYGNPHYVEQFANPLIRTLHRLTRDHITSNDKTRTTSDLMLWCLDVLKPIMESISHDLQRALLHNVLLVLIEKTNSLRLFGTIVLLVVEWMKMAKPTGPSLRERQIVLIKLMQCIDKKLPADTEVRKLFHNLVHSVYSSEEYRNTELITKLEPAFLHALVAPFEETRNSFSEILESTLPMSPFGRLQYIMCTQTWEPLQQHNWIKLCSAIMLRATKTTIPIVFNHVLPFRKHSAWAELQLNEFEVDDSANAVIPHLLYFCHMHPEVASRIFINCVQSLWLSLTVDLKEHVSSWVNPFLACVTHTTLRGNAKNVIRTFLEAFISCDPLPDFSPFVLSYLGKAHNVWHLSMIGLEKMTFGSEMPVDDRLAFATYREALHALADLHQQLNDFDMYCAALNRRPGINFCKEGLIKEQYGLFSEARRIYCNVFKADSDFTLDFSDPDVGNEIRICEERMLHCSQQLNMWDSMENCLQTIGKDYPVLTLECAVRCGHWDMLRDRLSVVETNCPKEWIWKASLYHGYLAFFFNDEESATTTAIVERLVPSCQRLLIKEWRRLPKTITEAHIALMQCGQQVIELQECGELWNTFVSPSVELKRFTIKDLKTLLKVWKNEFRTGSRFLCDDQLAWSAIATWRQQCMQLYNDLQILEQLGPYDQVASEHAIVLSSLDTARCARKQLLFSTSLTILLRANSHALLPLEDAYQVVHDTIKTMIRWSECEKDVTEKVSMLVSTDRRIQRTFMDVFTKKQMSKVIALHGKTCSLMQKKEKAVSLYIRALKIDSSNIKACEFLADFYERRFFESMSGDMLRVAIQCHLRVCCLGNEYKARLHFGRLFYLLKFDKTDLMMGKIFECLFTLPPQNLAFWIPQLFDILCSTLYGTWQQVIMHAARMYPQCVYYHMVSLMPVYGVVIDESSAMDNKSALLYKLYVNLKLKHPNMVYFMDNFIKELTNEVCRESPGEQLLRMVIQLERCYQVVAFVNCYEPTDQQRAHIFQKLSEIGSFLRESKFKSPAVVSVCEAAFDELRQVQLVFAEIPTILRKVSNLRKSAEQFLKQTGSLICKEKFCKSLLTLRPHTLDVLLPHLALNPTETNRPVYIHKFLPTVECAQIGYLIGRRFHIVGTDGLTYTYFLFSNDQMPNLRSTSRLLQLFRGVNQMLAKERLTASRHLQINVPVLIPIGPDHTCILDDPNSKPMIEFLKQHLKIAGKVTEEEELIFTYYQELVSQQSAHAQVHAMLQRIFKKVQATVRTADMIEQLRRCLPDSADFVAFRNQMAAQLGLQNMLYYVMHLAPLYPEELFISMKSGQPVTFFLRYEIDSDNYFDGNMPVGFRLTPAMAEFFGIAIPGCMVPCAVASARVLLRRGFLHWIRPFVWDEIASLVVGKSREEMIHHVHRCLSAVENRLKTLADEEKGEAKIITLFNAAYCEDNLCRMDPAWHPWF